MSPQLMQLTNTLRSKKKVCQGGHNNCGGGRNDDTMLPEKEVVFRAVSPHGHVYWEIDPKRDLAAANVNVGAIAGPTAATSDDDERNMPSQTTSSSDMSSSRQSSSRYSGDSHHPLIDDQCNQASQKTQNQIKNRLQISFCLNLERGRRKKRNKI